MNKYCVLVVKHHGYPHYYSTYHNHFPCAETLDEDTIRGWCEKYGGAVVNIIKLDEKIC